MKIPLKVRERFGQPAPFVFMRIQSKYHIRIKPIQFLVDTGSPWTVISPYDAMQLNIPIQILKKPTDYTTILFAGDKFQRLLLTNVSLRAIDAEGKIAHFDLPSISVIMPTTKKKLGQFKGIHSVLGCDFLNLKKLYLHFDPNKGEAFLSD